MKRLIANDNGAIEFLRSKGYPLKIKGNGGYNAYLSDIQWLNDGDYMAVYRYPGGECVHSLEEILNYCEIIEE